MAAISITNQKEISDIKSLTKKLEYYRTKNIVKEKYYEGKTKLKNLGIALPPKMNGVKCAIGWAGTAVDVLNERVNLEGFTTTEELPEVSQFFRENNLDLESGLVHLDSFIYGISYVIVGSGETSLGENKTLITVESPNTVVSHYNTRTRKIDAALKVIYEGSQPVEGTLFYPNETITFEYNNGRYAETFRDVHNLNIVPVIPFINRPRTADIDGRSEITETIISLTDSAVRTLVGMELQRELYSSPGKYFLGANKSEFKDTDGNALPLENLMSTMLVLGVNEEGQTPSVGQWETGSPSPFTQLLDTYIQQISSETGVPPIFLGYNTGGNPTSAEALTVSLDRLIKKAEDRTKSFGKSWLDVIKVAYLFERGSIPEEISNVRPIWRSAATPSLAAAADATLKLVSAGVLPNTSEVLYKTLGWSESEKEQVRKEKREEMTGGLIESIRTLADARRIETPAAAALAEENTGETPA
jgi:hypothetical protein